jgi:hypothetical protein
MIRNTMNDVIWMILKTDEGKQEKVCINPVILNSNREGDWKGKMMFISKIGASVIHYILCSHNIGSFRKTLQIKDSIISDNNIVKTVIERKVTQMAGK